MQAYDQTLLFVRSLYARDPERFDLAQWAHDQQFVTDVALQLGIIDKDGIFVGSNLAKASGRLDLSDREHFRVHTDTDRDELFISKPVVGRVSNKPSLQLSRRISAADGSFLGVVVVSIDPDYLSKFYDSVDTKKNGAVFLAGLDGVVRARGASTNTAVGRSLKASTLFDRLARANSGTYVSRGQLDGISRLSSYRVVRGYPLVVVVGLARDDVFATYERNRSIYFTAAGFTSLLVIIFIAMNLKYWRSLRDTRDKLRESESQYRSVVNGVREVIFQTDAAGSFTFLNHAWTEVSGFTVEDALNRPILDYLHPDDRAVAASLFQQRTGPERNVSCLELRLITASAEMRWIEIGARSTFNQHGLYGGMAGTMADVTSRRAAEAALRDSELKFRSMFDMAPVGIALTEMGGKILEVNQAFAAIAGRGADELSQLPFDKLVSSDQHSDIRRYREKVAAEGPSAPVECDIIGNDGSRVTVLLSNALASSPGQRPRAWSIIQDISDRKRAEKKIWEAANIDALTGLPNRQRLHEVMNAMIADADKGDVALTLMLIDLDNFKIVNDTLGHEAGDLVLRTIAARIRRMSRGPTFVARLGGDEFAVMLQGPSDRLAVEGVSQRILRLVQRKMIYRGQSIEIYGSVGIANFPKHAMTPGDLFRAADLALYQAKHAGRNRAVVFDSKMLLEAENKFEVLRSTRAAIAQGRVVPVYQPEFSIDSGEIVGFEALARIRRSDGELVTAAEFLPAFQDPEVGRQLGLEVVDRVTRDLQAWLAAGLDIKRIAVNASNIELRLDDFSDRVISMLRARGIGFHHFEVEVTETVALDEAVSPIGRNLRAFAAQGISLALDDFGTGFASLTHLKSLPITRVKVDQSFIRNIATDLQSRSIVDAIVRLSHSLGKSVVAEGVEEDAQLDAVRELKCDVAQGYLLAKPLRAEEIGPFMLRHIAQLAANSAIRDRFQGQRRPRIHIVASADSGGGTGRSG